MKKPHCIPKTIALGAILSTTALILVACGGSGGGGASASASPTPPASPPAASTNRVEKALSDGIYHLWGFGLIINGARQVFISKTEKPLSSYWNVVKVLGATTSFETAPRLDDLVASVDYVTPKNLNPYRWTFPTNSEQADLSLVGASSPSWTISFNQQDISGQTVLSQIKKLDGSLVSPALADASAVFPAGSVAYTARATSMQPMTVKAGRLAFVRSESTLFGSGWCHAVPGQTFQIGVQINEGGTTSLFNVAGTCSFTGLTPIGTGTWVREVVGGDNIYSITYPVAVTADPVWAPAFADGYAPNSKMPDLVINPASSPQEFYMAISVPVGSTFTSQQPFFNAAALPALRSAAGI